MTTRRGHFDSVLQRGVMLLEADEGGRHYATEERHDQAAVGFALDQVRAAAVSGWLQGEPVFPAEDAGEAAAQA